MDREWACSPSGLRFAPLTFARWADFERVFGARWVCGGCWCMWWRVPERVRSHL